MTTKWTPGPYQREGNLVYVLHGRGTSLRNRWSCAVQSASHAQDASGAECEAVATLIAAAPDLYEALAELVRRREQVCREVGGNPDGGDGRYSRARAILAKINGDQP